MSAKCFKVFVGNSESRSAMFPMIGNPGGAGIGVVMIFSEQSVFFCGNI